MQAQAAEPAPAAWEVMRGAPSPTAKTPLCLNTEAPNARLSQRYPWQVSLSKPFECSERFLIDLHRRQIFFDFDAVFTWPRTASEQGVAAGYCSPGGSYFGYTPCTSRFFDRSDEGYRFLNREAVSKLFAGIGVIPLLEQAAAVEKAANYERYKADFSLATTIEKIAAFERQYWESDPDRLIPKLQPLRLQLTRERYLASFNNAKTSAELERFIVAYGSNDPDELIPRARQKLVVAQAADQARAKLQAQKEAAAKAVEARRDRQKEAQRRVASCKRMTVMAYATLERERSIATVSGVENLAVKRQAGEIIVACQQIIGRGY